jgi:hypothetical protein
MKYVPLDNIGLRRRDKDGNLTTIIERGNNYPSNDTGIPKSRFVSTRLDNIVLRGKYEENETFYPLLDPVKFNITPIPNTTFRFIINLGSPKAYTSQGMYDDLIKAYEERNPWFSVQTVPSINLDLFFLKQYNLKNKFKVTEAYTETKVIQTLDTDEEILEYINWIVEPQKSGPDNLEILPIESLGSWEYVPDGDLGIGVKPLYDSMIKDKDPDPEAIGAEIIREEYSLELPAVSEVSGFLKPLPDEEIVPRLVDAILSERVPSGKQLYKPFGPVGFQVLGAVIAVAATLATFGALAPVVAAVGGVVGTALGGAAVATAVTLTPKGLEILDKAIKKASGSWVEYILKRSTTRQPFQQKRIVFNKEREDDLNEWNNLLLAAKGQMGVTKYTEVQVRAALAIIFAQFGPNVRPNDLSYPIEVGNEIKRLQVIPTSDRKVNLILK